MKIICESSFTQSNWYADIMSGLNAEARKRRETLEVFYDVASANLSDSKCAFIIGSSYRWMSQIVSQAQMSGCHPIILNTQQDHTFSGRYSYVSSDISQSISYILKLFQAQHKERIALYGINKDSIADKYRLQAFCTHIDSENVFYNTLSLSACFAEFFRAYDRVPYNAVICANDYAALSLIQHLKENGINTGTLSIISYSNTFLSTYSTPALSSITINYQHFASAAFMIASCVKKSPFITAMKVFIDWELVSRDTAATPENRISLSDDFLETETTHFYNDPELIEMMNIEQFLSHCDDIDRTILRLLQDGLSYEQICEHCFLTESALKYRLRKYKEACCVSSISALLSILHKYSIDLTRIK